MFVPKKVIFEEAALDYEDGMRIFKQCKSENIEVSVSKSGRIAGAAVKNPTQMYYEGKQTLVVGVRKTKEFESCKPSAHYQFPIVSGCSGMCEYCYLNTQMGKRPYTKIYVNMDELFDKANEYIDIRKPEITIFEGSATSDPVPVEHYSKALTKAIEYFARQEYAKFRFVTKFTDVDEILHLQHNGRTEVRFSINTDKIITGFEHNTPSFEERLKASKKIYDSGYTLGFIIAPVFLYEGWKEEYLNLINKINDNFHGESLRFEVISHRFTSRAKNNIMNVFPKTKLPMEENQRKFKYGQFGYGKYVYKNEDLEDMKKFFEENLIKFFGKESINYII